MSGICGGVFVLPFQNFVNREGMKYGKATCRAPVRVFEEMASVISGKGEILDECFNTRSRTCFPVQE
jgi:hypothetical protein